MAVSSLLPARMAALAWISGASLAALQIASAQEWLRSGKPTTR
jgi:hypothetical protein